MTIFPYILIFFQMEQQEHKQSSVAVQANSPSKVSFRQVAALQREQLHRQSSYMPFLFKGKRTEFAQPASGPEPWRYEVKSAFDKKSERDQLAEKYNIVLGNSKHIKQSAIFKSTSKRFNYKKNTEGSQKSVPSLSVRAEAEIGSPRRLQSFRKEPHANSLQKFKAVFQESLANYPSIPDTTSKFGYTMQDGRPISKILKEHGQLEKEKENMKSYVRRLKNEHNYTVKSFASLRMKDIEGRVQHLRREEEKLQELGVKKSRREPLQEIQLTSNTPKKEQKLFLNQTTKCNEKKVCKNLREKYLSKEKIGPGTYEVSQGERQESGKSTKYQFFNTTEARFRNYPDPEPPLKQKFKILSVLRNSEKGKIPIKQTQHFKRSRKNGSEEVEPGPGDYDPKDQVTRKALNTRGEFSRSARFKDLERNAGQADAAANLKDGRNLTQMNFKLMKRKDGKVKLRELCASVENMKALVGPEELVPLGKYERSERSLHVQKLRKSKQSAPKAIDQTEDRNMRSNDMSTFSICSWENRSQSRAQAIPSTMQMKKTNR